MLKRTLSVLLFLILALSKTHAQWIVAFEQNIKVSDEKETLKLPWAGGLNSGQYYNIDLDLDGQQDLIIFDRTSEQFVPLISQNQEFVYAPEYSLYFPENISNWVVFADYDGDGQQDLFTASGKRSITVYHNISDEQLAWELAADPLGTLGFSGVEVAIQLNPSDIPAIIDVDNDGDLDIVVYNVNGRGNLEYYQNMSQEQNGNSNTLIFEARNDTWGEIRECGCGKFAFEGNSCADINGRVNDNNKQLHVGGKSLLAIDVDGDGDKDILSSDEGCGELYFLENMGTQEEALFTSFATNYPEEIPFSFSAAYYVDATHDGIKDLIIAPNVSGETVSGDNMTASSWLYENVGTNEIHQFDFRERNFLQSEMIEVGENAAPVLADYDADGDLDLFIGNRGQIREDGYYAGIYLYENTGSVINPAYTLITTDYLDLTEWQLQHVKVYFEDMNRDGLKDLLVSGAESSFSSTANFYWMPNQASNEQLSWNFDPDQRQTLVLNFHPADQLEFIDAENDGDLDIFIAKREGNLSYYQNQSSNGLPDWELITESAGGINSSIFNRNLSVLLYDFEGDGQEDLLRSDASGTMLLYPDFITQLEKEAIADTVFASNKSKEGILRVDNSVSLAAAPLDDSGKTYILVGSPQGGIRLLSHSNEGVATKRSLLIYPNPTELGKQEVKVRAIDAIQWLQVISVNGAIVSNIDLQTETKEMTFDVTGLATGMYLIRVGDNQGKVHVEKLLVR